jgi:hypothetical protein
MRKALDWAEISEKHTSGAKAQIDSAGFMPEINPRPTARTSFSAASSVVPPGKYKTIRALAHANLSGSLLPIAGQYREQGLKPITLLSPICGTTEVVP